MSTAFQISTPYPEKYKTCIPFGAARIPAMCLETASIQPLWEFQSQHGDQVLIADEQKDEALASPAISPSEMKIPQHGQP